MPKFVKRAAVLSIVWVAAHAAASQAIAPQAAWGADHEFPVMNSVGRFFGVGYTKGGYHAAQDGRLNAISSRHPAADYRPSGLPPYAQPIYSQPIYDQPIYDQPLHGSPANGAAPALAPALATDTSQANNVPLPTLPVRSAASSPAATQTEQTFAVAAPVHPYQPPPRGRGQPEQSVQQPPAAKSAPGDAARPSATAPLPSPSDRPLYDASAGLPTVREVGAFSILDTGFPIPVYQVSTHASTHPSTQSSGAEVINRYR